MFLTFEKYFVIWSFHNNALDVFAKLPLYFFLFSERIHLRDPFIKIFQSVIHSFHTFWTFFFQLDIILPKYFKWNIPRENYPPKICIFQLIIMIISQKQVHKHILFCHNFKVIHINLWKILNLWKFVYYELQHQHP